MGKNDSQISGGNEPAGGSSEQSGSELNGQVQTSTKKRSMVRQRLAIALMAVGGTLAAAAILYFIYGRNSQ